jgi:beta-1,4-mannooligosaccharide/beta-1,4-mannosyl-N-acetylglucosamine phosphorylase
MSRYGLKSSPVMTRYPGNPVLAPQDVPYPSGQVFNAGVTKWRGRYVMVFRNDWDYDERNHYPRRRNLGLAYSDDGIKWEVAPKPCCPLETDGARSAYDPRLTVIDGRLYMCVAIDTPHGIRGGVAVTDDLEHFETLSMSAPDNRNMVLFPEKQDGLFMRLERPFPIYGRGAPEAFDMWFSRSPDCRYWGDTELVLASEQVPFANSKIGPAAPPVKTDKGWLTVFHAVYKDESHELVSRHGGWHKAYMAGVLLLDLDQPWRVIGMCRDPLLAPEEAYPYEMDGFRGSVIFPCGLIVEDDGEAKLYYGAADTVVALATAKLGDLIDLCKPV